MDKKELNFAHYLSDCHEDFEYSVRAIHDKLAEKGCKVTVQEAKSGRVVSFADPASGKVVANFISRKKGPSIRIYADHVAAYEDLLESLPKGMLSQLEKSSVCRRMLDPEKCNARCSMGIVFTIGDTLHKKCRYNCFLFIMDQTNTPSILAILDRELAARAG